MSSKEDIWFEDIVGQSSQNMSNPDIEDQIMNRIAKEDLAQIGIKRNKQLSWILFGIGTLFGLSLPHLIPWNDLNTLLFDPQQLKMTLNIVISIAILMVFGGLVHRIFSKRRIPL